MTTTPMLDHTTTTTTTTAASGAWRLKALRHITDLADTAHLPLPDSIHLYDHDGWRRVVLHLANDTDLTGWSAATGATRSADLHVTGSTKTWTREAVSIDLHDVPDDGWHNVEVDTYTHMQPITADDPQTGGDA